MHDNKATVLNLQASGTWRKLAYVVFGMVPGLVPIYAWLANAALYWSLEPQDRFHTLP